MPKPPKDPNRVTSATLEPVCSYTEIARCLGISDTMVQVIERRALEKLRRALKARGKTIDEFLDR